METTTTTHIDATTSQQPPPPQEVASSRSPLQTMIQPRNEKRHQQQQQSPPLKKTSSFRKVVFICLIAPLTYFQLFRNLGNNRSGFAAKTISKQQQRFVSSMTENNSTHDVTARITSSLEPKMSDDATITLHDEQASTSSSFLSRNNVTSKALEQKINDWLMTGVNDSMLPKPPHTPGAFIHVGKTGGSTLSSQLRNGCHSWVNKPCSQFPITNESRLSIFTTYYHTPDFHWIAKRQYHYDFYVWTLRDPFSRLLSAFTYQHPRNMGHAKDDKYWARFVRRSIPAFSCFPTLVRENETI